MSDQLSENDDDLEIVEVDEIPEQKAEEPDPKEPEEPEDESDDGEDDRLAGHDDEDDEDGEADATSANRKKRAKRRQMQKAAKERADRELRILREQVKELSEQVGRTNTNFLTQAERDLDARLAAAQSKVRQAELVMERATEAGNGADVVAALRMRDEAKEEEFALTHAKRQLDSTKQTAPAPDPRVKAYASDWLAQNPWYNPNGTDAASIFTTRADKQLLAEGYDPSTEDYWYELTSRVATKFGQKEEVRRQESAPKKKAPPMGATREHAPQSTKKEVYVTPERKQAMIDAGYWDDPKVRAQMLKEYHAYDRNSAR